MTDTKKLKGKIIENDYTIANLAKEIGLSSTALSQKINNIREFKVSEIEKICCLLNIYDNKDLIFFSNSVDKLSTNTML